METIKVNMTPCEDVQTIHASQNDTEAREWGFELHNNGEKIDSSSISDQLVFKAYEGGTEEILPTNGSTPTTSPFKGDIRYPQGLLTDQDFLYRESPTEEDGLAKITDIKGNTLVWNQLVPTNWVPTRTFSDGLAVTNNGDGSYTLNGTATQSRFPATSTEIKGIQGHKYYIQLLSSQNKAVISQNLSTVYIYSSVIYTAQNNNAFIIYFNANTYNNEKIVPMIIDLTQMGLDITNPSDFTSLFPLPYYACNQGTLLSFNGNGIKTVGKNQVANIVGGYFNAQSSTITVNNGGESFVFYALQGKTYVSSSAVTLNRNAIARCDTPNLVNGSPIYDVVNTSRTWTATWTGWAVWYVYNSKNEEVENSAQVEFGTTATAYEPYTSSTLSLPISTYFPSGMKRVNNGVYDELTETKAITRIGAVDMGTMTWSYDSTLTRFVSATIKDLINKTGAFRDGLNCARYEPDASPITSQAIDKTITKYSNGNIYIVDKSYTDATAFTESLQGQYLYFELAAYEETSFTTASLVTENAEIPLSNNDGVLICKCTEQLSENPGFFDAKIKLSDADGECYSNKLQLHVERKPS